VAKKSNAKTGRKWTAKELKARIVRKHPLTRGWFTVEEFCPSSGDASRGGRMDVLAVALYGSREFSAHGFEVKVARSDWLSELNNPSKNAVALQEVDFFWLVVPSTDIAKPEELPPKWGLMTCSGRGLRIYKRAERLKKDHAPFSRPFIVSLLWKVAHWKSPTQKALADEYRRGVNDGRDENRDMDRQLAGLDVRHYEKLKQQCADFKARSGIEVWQYSGGDVSKIFKALRDVDRASWLRSQLASSSKTASQLHDTIEAGRKQLDDLLNGGV